MTMEPFRPFFSKDLKSHIERMRDKYANRDRVNNMMFLMRNGRWDEVSPGAFNDEFKAPIVANKIDEFARHAASALAPLPTIICRAGSLGAPQTAKDAADKRTMIVNHYLEDSRVQKQMVQAADGFYLYGMLVASVVPDFKDSKPTIRFRDARGWYPIWDWKGDTVEAAHVFRRRILDLAAEYPEAKDVLYSYARDDNGRYTNLEVDVYYHDDGKFITTMIPQLGGLICSQFENPIGRCLTHATATVTDGEVKGTLDQLAGPQIARNEMQMLMLEAVSDAVQAPWVVPSDVGEVVVGPGAVIRTNTPQGAGRMNSTIPREAFVTVDHFKDEMASGAIVPEAMSGNIDSAVVTGKGVQQLMAGYSQQVALRQMIIAEWFRGLMERAFQVDEKCFGQTEKRIEGMKDGNQYSMKYTPAKAIGGMYSVDVSYGSATGLDPNRALVFELQLYGSGMRSKETAMRELPGNLNPADELRKIQVEQSRDAIMQLILGMAQAAPGMAAQGQDPSPLMGKIAKFTDELEKGKPLEQIALKLFPQPEEQPAAPEAPAGPGAPGASPEDQMLAQLQAAQAQGGAPAEGAAPAPGGEMGERPDLATTFAGLTSAGQPNLSAYVQRQRAA